MSLRTSALAASGLLSVTLLSGCMTTPPPARFAYFRVPCGTPGAVVATPIALERGTAAGNAPGAASPSNPAAAAPQGGAAATCVVAVADARSGYRRGYYAAPGYYGQPYYGSVGIGFGFGSHGGHHRSGGHHGSGHGSRRH